MWAGIGQLLTGVHSPQPRQNLLQAAGNVGQASGELLQQIGESDTDPHFQVGDLPNPQNPSFHEVTSDRSRALGGKKPFPTHICISRAWHISKQSVHMY